MAAISGSPSSSSAAVGVSPSSSSASVSQEVRDLQKLCRQNYTPCNSLASLLKMSLSDADYEKTVGDVFAELFQKKNIFLFRDPGQSMGDYIQEMSVWAAAVTKDEEAGLSDNHSAFRWFFSATYPMHKEGMWAKLGLEGKERTKFDITMQMLAKSFLDPINLKIPFKMFCKLGLATFEQLWIPGFLEFGNFCFAIQDVDDSQKVCELFADMFLQYWIRDPHLSKADLNGRLQIWTKMRRLEKLDEKEKALLAHINGLANVYEFAQENYLVGNMSLGLVQKEFKGRAPEEKKGEQPEKLAVSPHLKPLVEERVEESIKQFQFISEQVFENFVKEEVEKAYQDPNNRKKGQVLSKQILEKNVRRDGPWFTTLPMNLKLLKNTKDLKKKLRILASCREILIKAYEKRDEFLNRTIVYTTGKEMNSDTCKTADDLIPPVLKAARERDNITILQAIDNLREVADLGERFSRNLFLKPKAEGSLESAERAYEELLAAETYTYAEEESPKAGPAAAAAAPIDDSWLDLEEPAKAAPSKKKKAQEKPAAVPAPAMAAAAPTLNTCLDRLEARKGGRLTGHLAACALTMVQETNGRRLKADASCKPTALEIQDALFSQTQWLEQFCIQMQSGQVHRVALSLYYYELYGAVSLEQSLRLAARIPIGQDLNRQHSLVELAQANRLEVDQFFTDNDRLLVWVRYLAIRDTFFPAGNVPPLPKWLMHFIEQRLPVDRDRFMKEVYEGVIAHYQRSLEFIFDNEMRASPAFKRYQTFLETLKKTPLLAAAPERLQVLPSTKEGQALRSLKDGIQKTLRDHPHLRTLPAANPCADLDQVCIYLSLFEQHFEMKAAHSPKDGLETLFVESEMHFDRLFEHVYKAWLRLYGFRSGEILSHNLAYLSNLLKEIHHIAEPTIQSLKARNPGISHHYRHSCTILTPDQKQLLASRLEIMHRSQEDTLDPGFDRKDLSKAIAKQSKDLLDLLQRETKALIQEVARKGRETVPQGPAAAASRV